MNEETRKWISNKAQSELRDMRTELASLRNQLADKDLQNKLQQDLIDELREQLQVEQINHRQTVDTYSDEVGMFRGQLATVTQERDFEIDVRKQAVSLMVIAQQQVKVLREALLNIIKHDNDGYIRLPYDIMDEVRAALEAAKKEVR